MERVLKGFKFNFMIPAYTLTLHISPRLLRHYFHLEPLISVSPQTYSMCIHNCIPKIEPRTAALQTENRGVIRQMTVGAPLSWPSLPPQAMTDRQQTLFQTVFPTLISHIHSWFTSVLSCKTTPHMGSVCSSAFQGQTAALCQCVHRSRFPQLCIYLFVCQRVFPSLTETLISG